MKETQQSWGKESNPLPAELFARQDETDDALFYQQPRLVAHIDPGTIAALTEFYAGFISPGASVLDLMSSWISHLPLELTLGEVIGIGMNAQELAANPQLSKWQVQDLNRNPALDIANNSMDFALVVVSIQYLTNPIAVLTEVRRTLKAQGKLCIAMSHRMFPTKAIRAFHTLGAEQRINLVQGYLELAGYQEIEFIDASPGPGVDPLWLVIGQSGGDSG